MSGSTLRQRLAVILAADAAGYSRLMAMDDRATVAALDVAREIFRRQVESHQGRVIDMAGDSVLAIFETATGAVVAALDAQQELEAACESTAEDRRMHFRIGLHLGDVIEKTDGSVYGDGVNIASRLQTLAEPGGVTISDAVRGAVRGKVPAGFLDQGEQSVKNIPDPVRAFRITVLGAATGSPASAAPSASPASTASASPSMPLISSGSPAAVLGIRLPDKPSLAVLPFTNMSGDPEQEYFADGITEDIITDVSKISGLLVIARNSSFTFKNQSVDIKDVGRKLGVRHVLEGSVRKAGMKVRINVQLIDADSGGHVWAERYDRSLEDIFLVQDEVTRRIVDALKVNLTGKEEARREERGKVNAEAYDYLIRGRSCLLQFTPDGAREARGMLLHAIELDPGMALAYAALTFVYGTEYLNRWNDPGPDHLQRGLEMARKAIEADENEAMGHLAYGVGLMWLRRLDEAERSVQRAIELDPNLAEGYGGLGNVVDFSGQHQRAIPLFERAMRLDPQFDIWIQAYGRALYALERYDDAEAAFKRRLIRMPRTDVTRAYLASLYGNTNRPDEARKMWRELMEINSTYTVEHMRRILPYKDPAPLDRFVEGLRKAGLPR